MSSSKENDGQHVISEKANAAHVELEATEADHQMTPWQCIVQNPKIVIWTLYANLGAAIVGYENLALSVCLAMPAFQMTFAQEVDGVMTIPAYWQSAWNAMYNVMNMAGAVAAGYVQDWFGRRATFLLGSIFTSAGIAIAYTSEDSPMFLGAKMVTGFGTGLLFAGCQTYVSEIAPLPMRGIALSMFSVMMNLGMLIAISSTYSRVEIMDKSSFRVVFAAAWAFPGAVILGLPFVPESPYWLVMKGKQEKARVALQRLSGPHDDIDARLHQIQATVEQERRISLEKASLVECFKGVNWRRTRIILICMYMPQVVGASLSSNAPYFLNQTGLGSSTVIMLTEIGISLGVASSLLNIYLMMKFRHRPLMFFGVGLCVVIYLVMGIAGALPRTERNLLIIGVALQFTSISYGPAVGSSMAVSGEVSALRLRAKSLGVGTAFYSLVGTFWMLVLPFLFNTDEANLGGNIGWIYVAMGLIMLVVLYFDVPGTKGRSYDELDTMFEKKVPARRFEKYELNEAENL